MKFVALLHTNIGEDQLAILFNSLKPQPGGIQRPVRRRGPQRPRHPGRGAPARPPHAAGGGEISRRHGGGHRPDPGETAGPGPSLDQGRPRRPGQFQHPGADGGLRLADNGGPGREPGQGRRGPGRALEGLRGLALALDGGGLPGFRRVSGHGQIRRPPVAGVSQRHRSPGDGPGAAARRHVPAAHLPGALGGPDLEPQGRGRRHLGGGGPQERPHRSGAEDPAGRAQRELPQRGEPGVPGKVRGGHEGVKGMRARYLSKANQVPKQSLGQ